MRREPRIYIPEPPGWIWSVVGGLVSAWIVVQLVIWVGDYLVDVPL